MRLQWLVPSRPGVARALDLAPSGERPGPIGRVDPLRDDALEVHPAGVPEESRAVGALDMAREPQQLVRAGQQALQSPAALMQRQPAQILTIEAEQIERDQAGVLAGPL